MKKTMMFFVLLLLAVNVFAGDARVFTMGGVTGLLPDDNANIGLFPQRVNDWNILRIQDIGGTYYDYLLTTGEKGDKWAFYGSVADEDYFINVIRSLDVTTAVDVGLQFITNNAKFEDKDADDEIKVSNMTLGLDVVCGLDMDGKEVAFSGFLAKGPLSYETIPNNPLVSSSMAYGKVEYLSNGDTYYSSKAGSFAIGAEAAMRSPKDFFIFDQMYGNAHFHSWTGSMETESNEVTTQDDKQSEFVLGAEAWFFKHNEIMPENDIVKHARLMYGCGASVSYVSMKWEDKSGSFDQEQSMSSFVIGGPSLRIALEADIVKYTKLRFGIERDIVFFSSGKAEEVFGSSEEKVSATSIGDYGNLYINSGMGFQIGNLTIDIMLNKAFWENGPQMLFTDAHGNISFMTDVTYAFPVKK